MEQEPHAEDLPANYDQMQRIAWKSYVYGSLTLITVVLVVVFEASTHQRNAHVAPPFLTFDGTPKQRMLAITGAWEQIQAIIIFLTAVVPVIFALLSFRLSRTPLWRGLVTTAIANLAITAVTTIGTLFGIYLAALFGWINTVSNALVAIFTLVYVLATIVMVVQNERARQTQLQIAREQSTAQKEQDCTRDETARQTSVALTQLAANLAALTVLLDKQQGAVRQIEPPALSPSRLRHTTEQRPADHVMGVDS